MRILFTGRTRCHGRRGQADGRSVLFELPTPSWSAPEALCDPNVVLKSSLNYVGYLTGCAYASDTFEGFLDTYCPVMDVRPAGAEMFAFWSSSLLSG